MQLTFRLMMVNSVLHNMQVCDAISGSHTGLNARGLFSGGEG